MNNEETIIMQNESNKAQEVKNLETPKHEEKNTGKGKNIAAMTGAAVFGGAAGGAGTAAAANMFNKVQDEQEQEVQVEEETPAPTTNAKPEPKVEEKVETVETFSTTDEHGEQDYTGHGGADPVVTPQQSQQQTGNDTQEVQVLGVYHNDEGQEAAVLTNGETVAVVLDANGDGVANVIAIDENLNGQFDEGEIHDISDQHIGMNQFEEAYLAQQQEQLQQEDTFAYNASDETDYNNDAEVYDA